MKANLYNSDGFIWSQAWQEAVIGYCFKDPRMFKKCVDFLEPTWFTGSTMLQQVFTSMKEWYESRGTVPPSYQQILEMQIYKELPQKTKDDYASLCKRCCEVSLNNFELKLIQEHLTGFARASKFKETVAIAGQQFTTRNYDKAYKWTSDKIQELLKTTFEEDLLAMNLSGPGDWLVQEQERKDLAVTTGCGALDYALGGGLFKRETTAIMAPTNTGKTTFMVTVLRHALASGKRVLFFTHEGRPEAIRLSILTALVGIPRHKLYEFYQTPLGKTQIDNASKLMETHLTYIPYSFTGKMFVENVVEEAVKRQQDAIDREEQPYDIVIDDYPKKLKSKYRSGSKDMAYRTELAEVYDEFNHLAQEINVHCLLAIQTNRAGAKQNKDTKSDTLLDLEAIDESYGVAQNMGNVIALNRSPQDMKMNIINYTITKSRNEGTHVTVSTRTAYDHSLTHGDETAFSVYGQPFLQGKGHNRGLVAYLTGDNYKQDAQNINLGLEGLERKENPTAISSKFEIMQGHTVVADSTKQPALPSANKTEETK